MLSMDHVEAAFIKNLWLRHAPVCVVAGAYKGDTVAFLRHHFPSSFVHAYEPQRWAHDFLVDRFRRDSQVLVASYALGERDIYHAVLYEHGTDAASLIPRADSREQAECTVFRADEHLPATIDLFVMNMEGYEFILIPFLLNKTNVAVRNFIVQFHGAAEYTRSVLRTHGYKETSIGANWYLYVT